jgi:hypothetical protein
MVALHDGVRLCSLAALARGERLMVVRRQGLE